MSGCYLCGSTRDLGARWYHGIRVCPSCWLEHDLPFVCANHGGARPDGGAIVVVRRNDGTAACLACREEELAALAELDRDARTPVTPPAWPRRFPYPI